MYMKLNTELLLINNSSKFLMFPGHFSKLKKLFRKSRNFFILFHKQDILTNAKYNKIFIYRNIRVYLYYYFNLIIRHSSKLF